MICNGVLISKNVLSILKSNFKLLKIFSLSILFIFGNILSNVPCFKKYSKYLFDFV